MAFPTVAIGQKIKASWGNAVAARFNEAEQVLAFTPGANIDATTLGTFANWLTFGNITVPSWAVSALITTHLIGIYSITAAGQAYNLRTNIGAANGLTVRKNDYGAFGTAARFDMAWTERIVLAATGSQSITVDAARVAGAQVFRADTVSDFAARITFLDS